MNLTSRCTPTVQALQVNEALCEKQSVSKGGESNLQYEHILNIALYLIFVFICGFLWPLVAWLKGKRKKLAFVLVSISIAFGIVMYGYMGEPATEDDHGMVLFGMFFFVPSFVFILHMLLYLGSKVFTHVADKRIKN